MYLRIRKWQPSGRAARRCTALFLVAVGSSGTPVAAAAPESPAAVAERIHLGAITSGNRCQNFADGYRAVMSRLQQLGAEVGRPKVDLVQCAGLDCAGKLKGESGFLMGGQVRPGQSHLWVVDVAQDRVMFLVHGGPGADKPGSLARQAAVLAERLGDPLAPWMPRSQVRACAKPAVNENKSAGVPIATPDAAGAAPDSRIAVAVYAPRPVSRYAGGVLKGVRRSLESLGLQVREVRGVAPPGNPREALAEDLQELPLVDIQLLASGHGKKSSLPDGAVVRLSDGHRGTQAAIECGPQECEPEQLVHLVQRNTVTLLDRASEGKEIAAAAASDPYCIPADPCHAGVGGESSAWALALNEQSVSKSDDKPAQRSGDPRTPAANTDLQQTRRAAAKSYWVGGGVALFLGVAAVATAATFAGIQGKSNSASCNFGGVTFTHDCVWSNTPLMVAGFVAGPILIGGSGLLFWQAKKRGAENGN